FQAEVMIRYRNLTGVQTCALPIWRDLKAGGSWLGIPPTKQRFASVTNFREPGHPAPTDAISRGRLVQDFLIGDQAAKEYLLAIEIGRASCRHRVRTLD